MEVRMEIKRKGGRAVVEIGRGELLSHACDAVFGLLRDAGSGLLDKFRKLRPDMANDWRTPTEGDRLPASILGSLLARVAQDAILSEEFSIRTFDPKKDRMEMIEALTAIVIEAIEHESKPQTFKSAEDVEKKLGDLLGMCGSVLHLCACMYSNVYAKRMKAHLLSDPTEEETRSLLLDLAMTVGKVKHPGLDYEKLD
jgi:hypothetical protein